MKVFVGGWYFQLNMSLDPPAEVMLFFMCSSLLALTRTEESHNILLFRAGATHQV
jgi:hypothetical protein